MPTGTAARVTQEGMRVLVQPELEQTRARVTQISGRLLIQPELDQIKARVTQVSLRVLCIVGGMRTMPGNMFLVDKCAGRTYAVPYDALYATTSAPVGQYAKWRSRLYDLAASEDEVFDTKKLQRIHICYVEPAHTQTGTLNIYTNGDVTNVKFTTSLTFTAGSTSKRLITQVFPNTLNGEMFQFEITGTFTDPLTIQWIKVEYDVTAPSKTGQRG